MKQAARWVQGSALGRNGTSGSCAGGGEVVQRGQGAQGGGTKQQAGTKQTGSGSEQIRVGQGLPGQWVGVCQGEVVSVGAAREWGGREAKQAAGRHQWKLARSSAGGAGSAGGRAKQQAGVKQHQWELPGSGEEVK